MTHQGPVAAPSPGPVAGTKRRIVDLGLAVDRGASTPLPDQLERALRERIGRGELGPGDALPSSRALASELEVSRGVVVEAYDRLVRQGLLVARQGAAVRVSGAALGMVESPPLGAGSADAGAGTRAGADGPSSADPDHAGGASSGVVPGAVEDPRVLSWATGRPWRLRLHPATTPIGTLDRRAWGAALRVALREATEADVAGLHDPRGEISLREALSHQLSRSRGVITDPAHLTITSGVTDAIRALAPVLAARGGRVAVEDPGFVLHRATLIGSGLELVPVPADASGIQVDELMKHEGIAAVLLTPAHQMPLGLPLVPERRTALVRWARETGALLIEDDYDGELRYDRRGVRSLHALAPDRVIYLGSTSKVLSHGVRVGWMVTPPHVTDEAVGWRLPMGAPPSTIEQFAFAHLVSTGAFDRGVARLRRRCAAQRAALVEALAVAAPELEPTGVAAGLHLGVRVPEVPSHALVLAAAQRDIELFAADDGADGIMLVAFGPIDPTAAPAVARSIAGIAEAARAATTGAATP